MLQDLDVGHPRIDRKFVVQSARPDTVRDLFTNEIVRERVMVPVKNMRFGINENEGMLGGTDPDGVDLLHDHTPARITDPERLVRMFELLRAVLDEVTILDDESEMERQLRRLRAPGGIITGRVTLWEGGPSRLDALDELAKCKDPTPVEPLMEVLADPDPILQSKTVFALGKIGDEQTVPVLIRLLERRQGQLKRKLADDAGDALEGMGHGSLLEALDGRPGRLANGSKEVRPEIIYALLSALERPGRLVVSNTVQARAKLGAVEALPARTSLPPRPVRCRPIPTLSRCLQMGATKSRIQEKRQPLLRS